MKILLVYPIFPDTFWSFKHALEFVRKKAGAPPLGLLTIAAMIPEQWEKRLVDMNVRNLTDDDLKWADLVFLSAMVIQRDSAHEVVSRAKRLGVPVVAGGPLFTIEPEAFPEVDHLVLNEGEITLPQFLADLEKGEAKRVYTTDQFADITKVPAPLWHLADLKAYETVAIQFSRGCPFNCDFCNVTVLLGHRPRTKSSSQIITELDALYKLGWNKGVFFVDDNFIGNKRILKEDMLPALIRWREGKTGFNFNTEASINLADDQELMDLMVQAGFNTVFVGIETPNDDSLNECGKFQNRGRDLVDAVKRLHHAGLQVQGGFIVGFDSDGPSIFQQQIDFIQRSGIVTAMVGLLQAPPGTKLYERMEQEGRITDALSGDNVNGATNIIPAMDMDTLKRGYREILNHIYSPKHFYERVKTFLSDYEPPRVSATVGMEHIMAFFRSVYRLGIKGQERFEYWKLLGWTLFRKPRLFPLAVTMAIYGFHFRRVSELHVQ